jgi:hypothetical protein
MNERAIKRVMSARFRKPVHSIANRAKRYRANHPAVRPPGPKRCSVANCQTPNRFVVVDHRDGDEANYSRRNLRWLCKSHNTKFGLRNVRQGKGQIVSGRNSVGAKSLGAYVAAALEHKRGAHDAGGKIIHETPVARRRAYAREIWSRRRHYGTDRRENPRKSNAFGLDRFFGRKSRVTSEDWKRAGTTTRTRALKRAGVGAKLAPAYARLDWSDLQSLEPKFVTKLMGGLTKKNSRKKKSKVVAKRKASRAGKKRATAAYSSAVRSVRARRASNRKRKNSSAISYKVRQLRAQGLDATAARKAALRIVKKGKHTKPGKAYQRGGRRNPNGDARASQTYAMFHGRGPEKITGVDVTVGPPKHLAALGDMVALVLCDHNGVGFYKIVWNGKEKPPFLATDIKANQLYIVGGDQDMESILRSLNVRGSQDMLDLGYVKQIEYHTQKDFDGFKPIDYYHKFGEEDAKKNPSSKVRRPRLLYSRRNKKLMLAGGGYTIKKDGIIN